MPERWGTASVQSSGEREIVVKRAFDAPAEAVFDAWTQPAQIAKWWSDETMPLRECLFELRPGGTWRLSMESPDGESLIWSGEVREVERPRRLVRTEVFERFPELVALQTLTLDEDDRGVTRMELRIAHPSESVRDAHLRSGMEAGLQRSFDRMEHLVTQG